MNLTLVRVYAALIGAMLFWSVSFIWTKELLGYFGPLSLIAVRLFISTLFLLALGRGLGILGRIARRDWPKVAVLALFNPFLYFLGENFAMQYVSPTLAAVVIGTIPVFTSVAAFFLLGEKLRLLNYLGVGVSVAGVALVIGRQGLSQADGVWGLAFLLVAVAAAVGYALYIRQLSGRYNALQLTVVQNALGFVYFAPTVAAFEWQRLLSLSWQAEWLLPLAGLSVLCSSLAFVFFAYGIQHLGASRAGVFSNAIPIFTAFFAFWWLDEKLSLTQLAGVVFVIFGLFLSQIKKLGRPNTSAATTQGV